MWQAQKKGGNEELKRESEATKEEEKLERKPPARTSHRGHGRQRTKSESKQRGGGTAAGGDGTSTEQQQQQQERIQTETQDTGTDVGGDQEQGQVPTVARLPSHLSSTAQGTTVDEHPRQVIAVSASRGPAAFFNLARKFLVTDEMCDLSALEGAIVSAVDAAHLLERSQLARIVRVSTSYVTVDPKRRRPQQQRSGETGERTSAQTTGGEERGRTRELRRARIVITVQRTENYRQWLQDNPLQAVIAGDVGDEVQDEDT